MWIPASSNFEPSTERPDSTNRGRKVVWETAIFGLSRTTRSHAEVGVRRAGGERACVAGAPDQLTLKRHRDLEGRERRPVARRVLIAVLTAFLLAGALNAFGQRPQTDVAENETARFKVYSPERVRSGVFFESRFHIDARREIENAAIVLDPGWLEGITLNTLEPGPIGEASRDGKIALELGRIPAGQKHLFFLHFQVNPTNIGRRSADVELHDGERPLLHLDRTITIFP